MNLKNSERKNYPKSVQSKTTYVRISAPENLDVALEGLVRKVLKEQPKTDEIYAFAADYFEKLVEIREKAGNKKMTVHEICPFHDDEDAHDLIKLATTFAKPKYKQSTFTELHPSSSKVEDTVSVEEEKEEKKDLVQGDVVEAEEVNEVISGLDDDVAAITVEPEVTEVASESLEVATDQDKAEECDKVEVNEIEEITGAPGEVEDPIKHFVDQEEKLIKSQEESLQEETSTNDEITQDTQNEVATEEPDTTGEGVVDNTEKLESQEPIKEEEEVISDEATPQESDEQAAEPAVEEETEQHVAAEEAKQTDGLTTEAVLEESEAVLEAPEEMREEPMEAPKEDIVIEEREEKSEDPAIVTEAPDEGTQSPTDVEEVPAEASEAPEATDAVLEEAADVLETTNEVPDDEQPGEDITEVPAATEDPTVSETATEDKQETTNVAETERKVEPDEREEESQGIIDAETGSSPVEPSEIDVNASFIEKEKEESTTANEDTPEALQSEVSSKEEAVKPASEEAQGMEEHEEETDKLESKEPSEEDAKEEESVTPEDKMSTEILDEENAKLDDEIVSDEKEDAETGQLEVSEIESQVVDEGTTTTEKGMESEQFIEAETTEVIDDGQKFEESAMLITEEVERSVEEVGSAAVVEETEEVEKTEDEVKEEPGEEVERGGEQKLSEDSSRDTLATNTTEGSKETGSSDVDIGITSVEIKTIVESEAPLQESEETPEEPAENRPAALEIVRAAIIIQKAYRNFKGRQTQDKKFNNDKTHENQNTQSQGYTVSRKHAVFDNVERTLVVEEKQSTTESDSSLSSSATKVPRGLNRRTTDRSFFSSQSLDAASRTPLIKTRSLSTSRQGVTDFEVWNTIEKELEEAATKIQSNFRGYRARKQLRREDAVQITGTTTASSETLPSRPASPMSQHSTGEFHDTIVLSIHPI